jgi:hypothetical protein
MILQAVPNGTEFLVFNSTPPFPEERPPDKAVLRSGSALFDQVWFPFGCDCNLDRSAFFEFHFVTVLVGQRILNAEFSIPLRLRLKFEPSPASAESETG